MTGVEWSNWAGTQSCTASEIVRPASEEDVVRTVLQAAEAGSTLRAVGAGHSFSPLIPTSGRLVSLERMRGVVEIDRTGKAVRVLPGTPIADLGEPLWTQGLSLHNQGDIDDQHLAGAVATATHGSGLHRTSLSGAVSALRLVQADGSVVVVDRSHPDALHAAQISLGLLGIITEIRLDVEDAYSLRESIDYPAFDELVDGWHDRMSGHRHASFFWMPAAHSHRLVFLHAPPGIDMADRAYAKVYDEAEPHATISTSPGARVDRAYRIYPDPPYEGPVMHSELEYQVPYESGLAAFQAVRTMMRSQFPEAMFPVEVRTVAAEEAWLSPFYRRPSTSIAIAGITDRDHRPFMRAMAETLRGFGGRPHWGKVHFFDRADLRRVLPRFEDFCALRRQVDPRGMFLNGHLTALFA